VASAGATKVLGGINGVVISASVQVIQLTSALVDT